MMNKKNKEENGKLWEVFLRPKNGLAHRHCGSVHAADAEMAMIAARNVYTRRNEGQSLWVVPSQDIIASDPDENKQMFEPNENKIYRHPSFYKVPKDVGNM